MRDWWRRFFSVDNTVNEQSVIGVFWTVVSLLLLIAKMIFKDVVGMDSIIAAMSASLLCFGISGFKRS
jgi:hypothetical protein